MTGVEADGAAEGLRARRRDLRRELARVHWWRRLVAARRELLLARLADATSPSPDMDVAWEALAADAPTAGEVDAALWPFDDTGSPASLERLDSVDARLAAYEARLSATLEAVTSHMVEALGASKLVEVDRRA